MARNFGGGATDRYSATNSLAMGYSARVMFVAGWWRPTTLTATRRLCAWGTQNGIRIAATTSELEYVTNNVTTTGVYNTTGANFVVDEWRFVAFFDTVNTGAGGVNTWRMWVGTPDLPPVAMTRGTVTAGVGNRGSSTEFTIGNAGGGGSVAFQGDIGSVMSICSGYGQPSWHNAITGGSLTADEEEFILKRFVLPLWEGRMPNLEQFPWSTGTFDAAFYDLNGHPAVKREFYRGASLPVTDAEMTVVGTAATEWREPRSILGCCPGGYPWVGYNRPRLRRP